MSFWKSLERKVLRPAGRVGKAVAPIAGGVLGTALGGPLGGALGSTLGGGLKRGKFDLKNALMDGGSSLLLNGVMSKLGGIPGLGGGAPGAKGLAAGTDLMHSGMAMIPGQASAAAGGGIGDAVKGAVAQGGRKWLTGKNVAALGEAAIGGMGAYNDMQTQKLAQQRYEDEKRREDEERERNAAMDPMRSQLIQQILMRLRPNTMPGMPS